MFRGGEFAEYKIGVAEFSAFGGVSGAEAETGKVGRAETLDNRLQAVIPAMRPVHTVAKCAEIEIKIVTDDENVVEWDFIKVGEIADGETRVVIESLRLDKDAIAILCPDGGVFLMRLPIKIVNFSIKIQSKEAEVMSGEVVLGAGVAETDNELFHACNYKGN